MCRSPRSNVRRLAVGRLISVTGGAAAYTALMFTVWDKTHSATWQSVALLLTFGVVGILSPLTGHFGDRFDRRKVMVISESIAAAVFFAMAFVDAPKPLIALAFVSAMAESPFWSASAAAIPNLVEREEDIAWANSLLGPGAERRHHDRSRDRRGAADHARSVVGVRDQRRDVRRVRAPHAVREGRLLARAHGR